MIRLDRSELLRTARTYVIANTAHSLAEELQQSTVVRKLREQCSYAKLLEYYDVLTAKARRSELVMGLAYAVLLALILHQREGAAPIGADIDTSRLHWGSEIAEYLSLSSASTQIINLGSATPEPVVHSVSRPGASRVISPGENRA